MAEQNSCTLTAELLKRIALSGSVIPSELVNHISSCPACKDHLDQFVQRGSKSLSSMVGVPPKRRFDHEPELAQMLDAARSMTGNDADEETVTLSADTKPAAEDMSGHQLGSYELTRELGKGAMGAVYEARHLHLNKKVAIKLINASCFFGSQDLVARFQREMKAVGAIDHVNVVRASDAGIANGIHYLALEFVDGFNLSQLQLPLSVADAAEIGRQAAEGLRKIHESGMVHRDVKPANIMLSKDGMVKVADLGLALLDHSADLTGSMGQLGTPSYMAPEQIENSHSVDHRADIYALGATLYSLLSGRPVFKSDKGLVATYYAVVNEIPARLRENDDRIPAEIDNLIHGMLAKNPDDRICDLEDVAQSLAEFAINSDLKQLQLSGKSTYDPERSRPTHRFSQIPTPSTKPQQAIVDVKKKNRRIWPIALAAIVLLVTGLIGMVLFNRGWNKTVVTPGPIPVTPGPIPVSPEDLVDSSGGDSNSSGDTVSPNENLIDDSGDTNATVLQPAADTGQDAHSPAWFSEWSLVSEPAPISGIHRWTVDTKSNRGPIGTVVFSPDGKLLASTGDGTLRIRSAESGELLESYSIGYPQHGLHDDAGGDCTWISPTSLLILGRSDDRSGVFRLQGIGSNAATIECIHEQDVTDWWSARLACSIDGTVAVFGDDAFNLVGVGKNAPVIRIDNHPYQPGSSIQSLDWSPDGNLLTVAGAGLLKLYGKNGHEAASLKSPFVKANWSHDGKYVCASADDPKRLVIFECVKSSDSVTLEKCTDYAPTCASIGMSAVMWSSTLPYRLVVDQDKTAVLLDFDANKKEVRERYRHSSPDLRARDYDWTGNQLAIGTDSGAVEVVSLKNSTMAERWNKNGIPADIRYASWLNNDQGRQVFIIGQGEGITIDSNGAPQRPPGARQSTVDSLHEGWAIAALPSGELIRGCHQQLHYVAADGRSFPFADGDVVHLALSPNHKWLVTFEQERTRLWKMSDIQSWGTDKALAAFERGERASPLKELKADFNSPLRPEILNWKNQVRVVGEWQDEDGYQRLKIWNPASNGLDELHPRGRNESRLSTISALPNSDVFAIGYSDGFVLCFELASTDSRDATIPTFKRKMVSGLADNAVNNIAWLEKGVLLAFANGKVVAASKSTDGSEWAEEPPRPSNGPNAGLLSGDKRFLLTPTFSFSNSLYGCNYSVEIWDAANDDFRRRGRIVKLGEGGLLAVSNDGHVNGPSYAMQDLVYIVATPEGQKSFTQKQFEKTYGWKNTPDKVRLFEQ